MYDPNLNLKLSKLKATSDDIILIKCEDNSYPNSRYTKLMEYISKKINPKGVILIPSEIKIETVEEDNLQELIDKLIELRDSKWKSRLKKGDSK